MARIAAVAVAELAEVARIVAHPGSHAVARLRGGDTSVAGFVMVGNTEDDMNHLAGTWSAPFGGLQHVGQNPAINSSKIQHTPCVRKAPPARLKVSELEMSLRRYSCIVIDANRVRSEANNDSNTSYNISMLLDVGKLGLPAGISSEEWIMNSA